jgi:alcohol dehydrogenase class IV
VPTTAGTGSEATKNAVISKIGPDGFKKSLRHDNFVPDVALIDPELTLSCPPDITAACGMDAFTQLLESYVSTKASPITDALAYSGLKCINETLIKACKDSKGINARIGMMYASLISGITLANAGLGIVHGLASPIGGYFNIPHGVVCGTLIGTATKINIQRSATENDKAYEKFAQLGEFFSRYDEELIDADDCCRSLINTIEGWIEQLNIPRLGQFGIKSDDLDRIVAITGNKNNPVELSKDEIKNLILERL